MLFSTSYVKLWTAEEGRLESISSSHCNGPAASLPPTEMGRSRSAETASNSGHESNWTNQLWPSILDWRHKLGPNPKLAQLGFWNGQERIDITPRYRDARTDSDKDALVLLKKFG